MSQQHLDGYEVDEDGPLVGFGLDVTLLEGVGQILLGPFEVVVEHVLPPYVILVGHLLGLGVPANSKQNHEHKIITSNLLYLS